MKKSNLYKRLPRVDELLMSDKIANSDLPVSVLKDGINTKLEDLRDMIKGHEICEENDGRLCFNAIAEDVISLSAQVISPSLKRVINCTGVVIHTNLGRSPLSERAGKAISNICTRYSNLEIDLESGKRGLRYLHVEEQLKRLTGAEAALVVNNNAAAVMLALSTMGKDKNVIVSRGQLVEIGGAFRVPEVMKLSGCKLYEVGTTNKTHTFDYDDAVEHLNRENMPIGALLKVHTSNYRVLGFASEVETRQLSDIGKKHGIPVIEDIGSGSLIDFSKYGIGKEPTVQESIKAGIDIVTFSGDKMLGGPQAGIIVGKKKHIDAMKKNQLTRAVRIDKMSLAALETVLLDYADEKNAVSKNPVLSMLTKTYDETCIDAGKLLDKMKSSNAISSWARCIHLADGTSEVGGGSLPLEQLPTRLIAVKPVEMSISIAIELLRGLDVPVICRVSDDKILIDVRTIFDDEYEIVVDSFAKIAECKTV